MAMRTTPRFLDDAQQRIETEQRRAAYQARLERDRRIVVGIMGLGLVMLGSATVALAGAVG